MGDQHAPDMDDQRAWSWINLVKMSCECERWNSLDNFNWVRLRPKKADLNYNVRLCLLRKLQHLSSRKCFKQQKISSVTLHFPKTKFWSFFVNKIDMIDGFVFVRLNFLHWHFDWNLSVEEEENQDVREDVSENQSVVELTWQLGMAVGCIEARWQFSRLGMVEERVWRETNFY